MPDPGISGNFNNSSSATTNFCDGFLCVLEGKCSERRYLCVLERKCSERRGFRLLERIHP